MPTKKEIINEMKQEYLKYKRGGLLPAIKLSVDILDKYDLSVNEKESYTAALIRFTVEEFERERQLFVDAIDNERW
ncbi:hypothetical protein FEZ48_06375 [Marinilactibacillus psychrotolerans]|uniref:Uncharacterized protein n=1 Tax=Marinilactibacillus psychrotolerans TaxID=191770 RepID=A0A5R9C4C5_9LACT|nr:hypothetical protein [Marinilactibacillus psychrotolerans]TLQ07603.1 hypothetical protein FEZ48_06375 [Marinilactibacillus psychrotolerans]